MTARIRRGPSTLEEARRYPYGARILVARTLVDDDVHVARLRRKWGATIDKYDPKRCAADVPIGRESQWPGGRDPRFLTAEDLAESVSSFTLDSYEFVEGRAIGTSSWIVHGGGKSGICPVGFQFEEANFARLVSGPLTSILAVRHDR